jgi:hypothetical protein
MAKRFRALEQGLKYLRVGTSDTNPQAPAGTPLRQYQDWKAGTRTITYTREAASKPGKILKVGVNPFAYPVSAESLALVSLSKRANDNSSANTISF